MENPASTMPAEADNRTAPGSPVMADPVIPSGSPQKTSTPETQGLPAATATPSFPDQNSSPAEPEPFDWQDFRTRYEAALEAAQANEATILEEAAALSQYFRLWASSASSHDEERAVKRLRSQQRFVELAEDRMQQKQQHYQQVVQAFESALALLRST